MFTYEDTIELNGPEGSDIDRGFRDYEVRFIYNVNWGAPEQGPTMADSGGQPAEHPSIEMVNVHVLTRTMSGKDRWFDATETEYNDFCDYPSDDDLIAHARAELSNE